MLRDYRDYYKEINKFGYNVVAYCTTPWHMKGVEAALDYLSEIVEVRPLILLAGHTHSENVREYLSEEAFSDHVRSIGRIEYTMGFEYDEGYGKKKNFFTRVVTLILSNKKKTIYIINPELVFKWATYIDRFCLKNVHFILVDNGMGGYVGLRTGDPLWSPDTFDGKAYSFCKRITEAKRSLTDFRLLCRKKNGLLYENELAVRYYRNALEKNKLVGEDFEEFNKKIIFNGTPINDLSEENREAEMNCLKLLHEALGKLNAFVLVKPHPRDTEIDRFTDLGWKVYGGKTVPQEEIISKMKGKPLCIISMISSSAANIKALYGIETISLVKLFNNRETNEKSVTYGIDEKYVNYFGKYILMPSNVDELTRMIHRIVDEYDR